MKKIGFLLIMILVSACVVIPKETVTLSETLGSDLKVLHNAHRNIVSLHYQKIKDDINSLVDEVYAPFIINYVLKDELKNYKAGNPSLFGTIEIAGQKTGKEESDNALKVMSDFLDAARDQIETKRNELISPIESQESKLLLSIDQSYEHVIYANDAITSYLQSIRKVKATQEEALSMLGLEGADTLMSNSLVKLSNQIDLAIKKGKDIDTKSDEASKKIDSIMTEIKSLTKNK